MDDGTVDTQAERQRAAAAVDRILLEQGEYSPLELVLLDGLLAYTDYEAWRQERIPVLEDALRDDLTYARRLLRAGSAYAERLGLVSETVEYRSWAEQRPLRCSREAEDLYRTRYRSPADTLQLDLFHDSTEVVLLNGLRDALAARREPEARRLLDRCHRTCPGHPLLPALEQLVAAQRMLQAPPADAARELDRLSTEIEPAAAQVLGARARDFLVPHWRHIATALAGWVFDPERPELHASFAAARAQDWTTVLSAVEGEADWRAEPLLIVRHAQAAERLGIRGTALADWCRLCWDFPQHAAREVAGSRLMSHQWSVFQDLDAPLENEDFPAWAAMRGRVRWPLPENTRNARARETPVTVQRLVARSQPTLNPATLADRETLKTLHPVLFEIYMTRLRQRETGSAPA